MTTPNNGDSKRAEMQQDLEDLHARHAVDREIIAQLEAEGVIDRRKIANLEVALITCRRIGEAMGILMAQYKMSDEQAFAALRAASQQSSRKLRDIADDAVLAGTLDMT